MIGKRIVTYPNGRLRGGACNGSAQLKLLGRPMMTDFVEFSFSICAE